jgi:hypothetical protein
MGDDLPDSKLTNNDDLRYENVRIFINKVLSYVELPFIRFLRHKIFDNEQRSLSFTGAFIAIVIMLVYFPDRNFTMSYINYIRDPFEFFVCFFVLF